MRIYSRFFKEVSQLNHSIEYCTWNSYSSSGLGLHFLIPSTFWRISPPTIPPVTCILSSLTVTVSRCYFSFSFSLFFRLLFQKHCRAILQPIWHQQIYRMDHRCCTAVVGCSLFISGSYMSGGSKILPSPILTCKIFSATGSNPRRHAQI